MPRTSPQQLDLFNSVPPEDLILPPGHLLSIRAMARATGLSINRLRADAAECRLDALRFVAGAKYFIPRPAAVSYLREAGFLPR